MMYNPQTVESAAKIASFYHLGGLEDRIMNLRRQTKVREKKVERLDRERAKETERRFPPGHSVSNGGRAGKSKTDVGFAPRVAGRRHFDGVRRAETPMSSGMTGRDTVVPETPTYEDEMPSFDEVYGEEVREASPGEKRKRRDETEEEFTAPKKRGEESVAPGELVHPRRAEHQLTLYQPKRRRTHLRKSQRRAILLRSPQYLSVGI